jgi:hypothetical protein
LLLKSLRGDSGTAALLKTVASVCAAAELVIAAQPRPTKIPRNSRRCIAFSIPASAESNQHPPGQFQELLPELTSIVKDGFADTMLVYLISFLALILDLHSRRLAIKAHLTTMHAFRFSVEAGGLMSYGATFAAG